MMTFTTSRTTTSRTIAAAAAVAAASTLAACGSSDSQTAADAPSISSSTSNATSAPSSSSTSASPSSSASATSSSTTKAPAATPSATQKAERASRSQQRQALPALSYVNWTQVQAVPSTTQYVYSADLPKGVSKVTQAGQAGTETVTYRSAKSGAKVVSTTAVDTQVTKAAVRRVVTIGTGRKAEAVAQPVAQQRTQQVSRSQVRRAVTQQAAPKRATTAVTTTQASSAGAGGSSRAAYWNNVASCESTNNWHINSGNGFFGGLQFTQSTWAGYGGLAYAPRADLATPAQQMAIADKVLASQGPGAWPVCHTRG